MSATSPVYSEDPDSDGDECQSIEKEDSDLIELNTKSLASLQTKGKSELSYAQSWAQHELELSNAEFEEVCKYWIKPEAEEEIARDLYDTYVLYFRL